jgi:sugar/nucleoside kinase (ribokinase family)
VCYGEIGVDNIIRVDRLPTPELAVFPSEDTSHIGGAAANTAVWLARWGAPVRLAGNAIGYDDYGTRLLGWLREHAALDLAYLERREEVMTPYCRVLVTPDAERSFLIFGYPRTPKTPLTREMLGGAKFLALDLYGGAERLAAARLAREMGIQTVIGDVIAPDHPALPFTDIATNSAAFIRDSYPGVNVLEHARKLQAVSRGIVVLTDGPAPVQALSGDGALIAVQPPAVRAVDATGAGDVFRAGLIYALLQGWPLAKAVKWGAAAGALGVQRTGAARNVPSREEVGALAAGLAVEIR